MGTMSQDLPKDLYFLANTAIIFTSTHGSAWSRFSEALVVGRNWHYIIRQLTLRLSGPRRLYCWARGQRLNSVRRREQLKLSGGDLYLPS